MCTIVLSLELFSFLVSRLCFTKTKAVCLGSDKLLSAFPCGNNACQPWSGLDAQGIGDLHRFDAGEETKISSQAGAIRYYERILHSP